MDSNDLSFEAEVLRSCSPSFKSTIELGSKIHITPSKQSFPTTRYYGSKLRLIEWIHSILSKFEFHSVLDPFGGTATVSLLFKSMDKKVTFNDILKSNYYIAKSILSADSYDFNKDALISFPENVKPYNGFIHRTFKDIYYYDSENSWLDGAVRLINKKTDNQLISDLYYCLFQSCLQKRPFNLYHRKNLYIRKNCGSNTKFGNWRTWERSFDELFIRAVNELEKAKNINFGNCRILDPIDASLIKPGYDLVYIDPPYIKTKKNDLNYNDRYHFLEGMCQYDNWDRLIDYNKKNFPLKSSNSIFDWNSKKYFKERLFDLISKHKSSIVVLSYATNGYPDSSEIEAYFRCNFSNVALFKSKLSHSLKRESVDELMMVGASL